MSILEGMVVKNRIKSLKNMNNRYKSVKNYFQDII